ncbi:hypothetical protein JHK84_028957 [Glycine max]|nr:hypothetical protein JHK85_029374 [Glycine max]KAG5004692.1 hypothetical protein JHK86_028831 [Glycine max]KAG5152485.1 hypothetical protein JHK84_028957 [Glycine max]
MQERSLFLYLEEDEKMLLMNCSLYGDVCVQDHGCTGVVAVSLSKRNIPSKSDKRTSRRRTNGLNFRLPGYCVFGNESSASVLANFIGETKPLLPQHCVDAKGEGPSFQHGFGLGRMRGRVEGGVPLMTGLEGRHSDDGTQSSFRG